MRKQTTGRKSKKSNDDSSFDCITNLEEMGLNTVISQYEAQTGMKVDLCEKCKPAVAELLLFFFVKLIEDLNPELFKELNRDDD